MPTLAAHQQANAAAVAVVLTSCRCERLPELKKLERLLRRGPGFRGGACKQVTVKAYRRSEKGGFFEVRARRDLVSHMGASMVLAFIFLVLETIGRLLEDPFSMEQNGLALTAICRTIEGMPSVVTNGESTTRLRAAQPVPFAVHRMG